MTPTKRLLVLDTNVLLHDPSCLLRFDEHDVFLPMTVLEELDSHKKGVSELARNVRQANRFLLKLIGNATQEDIAAGIPLPSYHNGRNPLRGRLFFQTDLLLATLPDTLPGHKPDNNILATTLAVRDRFNERTITLVSKDINLRIKAGILGIHSEDYFNDRVLTNLNDLHNGIWQLPDDFWERHITILKSWQEAGYSYYLVNGDIVADWFPNDCLYTNGQSPFQAIVRKREENQAVLQTVADYRSPKNAVWGVTARNIEQNFALSVLLDPDIDFVTIQGPAGTGKTLMTLAAGLMQALDKNLYQEIIMTRVTVPVGEDIGFLPGTEEEKMNPWMGALMDNLEVLCQTHHQQDWQRDITQELLKNRVKIRSLNFMRGRTFLNRYVILDEAQNLTSKQIKTLVTRAGPGTKIICLGDLAQIDTPYLTEATSGLSYAIDRFKHWQHSAHITLTRTERSRLAEFAAEVL